GSVSVSGCPLWVLIDPIMRLAWVAAQCSAGNDVVTAVNADTFAPITGGAVGSGGVQGAPAVNTDTHYFYICPNGNSPKFINPSGYGLTPITTFGCVMFDGINPAPTSGDFASDRLYAQTAPPIPCRLWMAPTL